MTTELVPTTALVPHKNQDQKHSTQDSTVFTRFLKTLQGFQEPTHTDAQTRVSHCDVPLVRILLSGTWMVMRKLSTQLELPLSTATDAIGLAERVNRLICAGMVLEYGTPEGAARAFWREVVELVDTAHTLGYQPGMQVGAAGWRALLRGDTHTFKRQLPSPSPEPKGFVDGHWRAPCMLFVAKLFKRARTYREELVALQAELLQISNPNHASASAHELYEMGVESSFAELAARETVRNGFTTHHASEDLLSELDKIITYLSPSEVSTSQLPRALRPRDDVRRTPTLNVQAFRSLASRTRHGIDQGKLWSHFSLRPDSWPVNADVSVDLTWLKTQILLSLLGAPDDADTLPSVRALNQALTSLREHEDKDVYELTWMRLSTRLSAPLAAEEVRMVRERIFLLLELIRSGKNLSEPTAATLSDPASSITGYLVHLRDSDIFIDHEDALDIAVGNNPEALASTTSELLNSGEDPSGLLTRVAISILWGDLDLETLTMIVRARVLKPLDIMDGFDAVGELPDNLVRELVALNEGDHNLVNLVMRKGYRCFTTRQLKQMVPHLDSENIDRVADWVFEPGQDVGSQQWVLALLVLAHLSPSSHKQRLRNRTWRTDLAMSGTSLLQTHEATARTYDAIRERMGTEAYTSFVLASAAWSRWVDPKNPDNTHRPESSWEDTFETHGDPFIPPRVMGPRFTTKDGRALCERIPEEEARAWTEND